MERDFYDQAAFDILIASLALLLTGPIMAAVASAGNSKLWGKLAA